MTYERLKQFLILSICSVLLLGLIADEARAQLCLLVDDGTGSAQMTRKPGGGCERRLESEFDGSDTSITGGFHWGDDDETNFFSGTGKKSFPDWVTDDIKRGRNDDEFCTNVVERITGMACGDDGTYKDLTTQECSSSDPKTNVDIQAFIDRYKGKSFSQIGNYDWYTRAYYFGKKGNDYGLYTMSCYRNSETKESDVKCNPSVDGGGTWKFRKYGSNIKDISCVASTVMNDDLAKKFNDLNMNDFVETPAFDQYMEELEKIGIHWTGKLETEKKKVEEKTDYHPDGTQSLTELYESKEYSYNGQTNSNNNKLYPTQEKTHSTTVVDGKTTSSGTSTRPGKGANSGESGNGSGDGDGPLDAKVDGSQIGLGESPEIPELYQQKYKNTDWAEIVEDGLQDNPMLDNLKGIGSQYTTGVCPSFEQEFFGELIVIDVPCELLDMIRAFFLTISSISAFWIIFRRA